MRPVAALNGYESTVSLPTAHQEQMAVRPARRSSHSALLERFEAISLAEMDGVALMDRLDTKYVLSGTQLPGLLDSAVRDYRVLEVAGTRLSRYRTLYYDTAGLKLYASHHSGRPERFKVRSRAYLDSGVAYLEVKHRQANGRTLKERVRTEGLLARLTPEAGLFLASHAPIGAGLLHPVLWNEFSRITLVGRDRPERVTIDIDVRYRLDGGCVGLDGVVVVEVKQASVAQDSPLIERLRALGLHPSSFSKYCVGVIMLYPGVKHNRFKPVLMQVENVMRGRQHVQ